MAHERGRKPVLIGRFELSYSFEWYVLRIVVPREQRVVRTFPLVDLLAGRFQTGKKEVLFPSGYTIQRNVGLVRYISWPVRGTSIMIASFSAHTAF